MRDDDINKTEWKPSGHDIARTIGAFRLLVGYEEDSQKWSYAVQALNAGFRDGGRGRTSARHGMSCIPAVSGHSTLGSRIPSLRSRSPAASTRPSGSIRRALLEEMLAGFRQDVSRRVAVFVNGCFWHSPS
jgi:hypothetical protein